MSLCYFAKKVVLVFKPKFIEPKPTVYSYYNMSVLVVLHGACWSSVKLPAWPEFNSRGVLNECLRARFTNDS